MRKTATAIMGILMILLWGEARAQQDVFYSQYSLDPFPVNPAFAGSRGVMSITASGKYQWAGLEGAPRGLGLNIQSPLKNDRMGLGGIAQAYETGPLTHTNITAAYTYRFPVGEGQLGIGIEAGANLFSVNRSRLITQDYTDPAYTNLAGTNCTPDAGIGIYFNSERLFMGISARHLFSPFQKRYTLSTGESVLLRTSRHYYLMAGGIIPIGYDVKFRPSALLGYTRETFSAQATADFIFYEKFTAGLWYRTGDNGAAGLNALLEVVRNLRIGYAYDYNLNRYTAGHRSSHEVVIRLDIDVLKKPCYCNF